MTKDPAWALAEVVCSTRFDDLPEATRTATRNDILDTLGCLLGGSCAPGIAELARVVGGAGGVQQAQVMLWDLRLPAPQAALMNASMAHALDFDDTLDHGGSIHPGASVLAATLAVSDLLGGVSGRTFTLAVALGLDVSCRVALASTLDRGWHRTAAMGVFGAAAAAGKLLGLEVEQMVNALGIAFSQAAGNRQCITDGALTKRLQAGQAASSGVLATTLAREGFTGAHNIFGGRFGFFELYQPNGYDAARLLDGLGERFRGDELSFKPYPCGRPQHAILDAAIAAHHQLGLGAADILHDAIASVTLTAGAGAIAELTAGPHKRRPSQIVEAQFALPFLIAAGLTHGRLGIDQVADIGNGRVLDLAARVEGVVNDAAPRLTVLLRDGRRAEIVIGTALGAPGNPLSSAQLQDKFRDCARHAVRPIPDETIAGLLQVLAGLEGIENVQALTNGLG